MTANDGLWAIGIPNDKLPAPAFFIAKMQNDLTKTIYPTQRAAIGEEFPVNLEVVAPLAVWKEHCPDLRDNCNRRIRLMTNADVSQWFEDNAPLRGYTPDELYEMAVAAQTERLTGPAAQPTKPVVKPKSRNDLTKPREDGKIARDSPVNPRIQSMCAAADDSVPEENRLNESDFISRLRLMIPRLTAADVQFLRENAPFKRTREFAAGFKVSASGVGPEDPDVTL